MVINSRNGLFIVALLTLMPQIKVCIVTFSSEVFDEFSFASYYGDHMVLQRGPKQAVLWGFGPSPGSNVTVSLDGKSTITAIVDRKNTWTILLPAVTDTHSHIITAVSSAGKIMLSDVLFGDVWICSGQSNMQFTLGMGYNATQEIADAAKFQNVRVFTVAMNTSETPLVDLKSVEEVWSKPNNASLGGKVWTYFSALCWLYGKRLYQQLNYPIGLVASTWGGTPIEAWTDKEALRKCGITNNKPGMPFAFPSYQGVPTAPAILWNSRMFPLTKMTIYGVIWYQGEANAGKPDTYNCTFPEMISSWRTYFHSNSEHQTCGQFPFGFVQLAAYRNDPYIDTGFPDIRWHQTADYGFVPNKKMPRVFMAAALDLPDYDSPFGSIHPRDKQDVADRLFLSAMAIAYGKNLGQYQGPFPTRYAIDKYQHTILIVYDNETTEIEVKSKDGFEICCSDIQTFACGSGDWLPADIIYHNNTSVSISYLKCDKQYVVEIRYAWRETPCPFKSCAIYGIENSLPAPPFLQRIKFPLNMLG